MPPNYEACLIPLRTHSQDNPSSTQFTPLSRPPPSRGALLRWPVKDVVHSGEASNSTSHGQTFHNDQQFGEKLLDGDSIHLSFRSPTKLSPHIQLSVAPLSQLLGQADPGFVESEAPAAVIKLTREACKRLEFFEIDKVHYERLTGLQNTTLNEHYYLLLVDCDSHKLSAERLFVEGCPDVLRELRDNLRSDTKFGIFIRSPADLRSSFSWLISAFVEQVRSDPTIERLKFLDKYLYELRRRRLHPKDVPSISGEPRLSFFNMDDYIATFGIGAMIESILTDREKTPDFNTKIGLIEHEKGDRKKFTCAFEVPWKCQHNLNEGDKASAILSLDSDVDVLAEDVSESESDVSDSDEDSAEPRKHSRGPWELQILPPVPNGPSKVAWAMIERQWDNRRDRFRDDKTYPVSSLATNTQPRRSLKAVILSLIENTTVYATILPEDRHSIFVYVFEAMSKLRRGTEQHLLGDIEKLLLGSRLDELAPVDIYGSLSDRSLASEDEMELNESQKDGIRYGRHALAGLVSIHGGPGTGKTHFIIQAVSPFLRDTEKRHRVLLTAASNVSVDSMAGDLQKQLELIIARSGCALRQYIIRLHSIKTEKSIVLREAKLARQRNLEAKKLSARKAGASKPGQIPTGGEAATILAHCQTFTERRYDGIRDERVRCINLSAGEVALQIAGIRPDSALSEPETFETFTELYWRFSNGEHFESEHWTALDAALEELLAHTIKNASAVCATVAGAADGFFTQHYADAELLVVDEAARIPEYQMWPLLVVFPRAVGKIMVGDPNQLSPTIKDDNHRDRSKRIVNPSMNQLLMSFQQRIQSLGFKTIFFDKQYRSVAPIADIYSQVCYDSKLGHGRPEALSNTQLAKDVIEHNRRTYGVAEPVVFYTVEGAEQGRNRKGSRFCEQYVLLVLRILQDLFDADFATPEKPCSIAILTPYKEEQRLLLASLAKMETRYPPARSIKVHTVDSAQGLQFDMAITDPVVVETPGFLDENRLNVMFSRARFALYVVGDNTAWSEMSKDDSKPLKKFKAHFSWYEKQWDASKKLGSEFFDQQFLEAQQQGFDS